VTALSLIFLMWFSYQLGMKANKRARLPEMDEVEQRKQQQLLKDFNEVMSYNEKKAYARVREE